MLLLLESAVFQSVRLFRRRADVDINLLIATEKSAAKNKKRGHHEYHEDYKHCYDARTASATVLSHVFSPL
jgi:hypothetical protein